MDLITNIAQHIQDRNDAQDRKHTRESDNASNLELWVGAAFALSAMNHPAVDHVGDVVILMALRDLRETERRAKGPDNG